LKPTLHRGSFDLPPLQQVDREEETARNQRATMRCRDRELSSANRAQTIAGTSARTRAFVLLTVEANMPLALGSYLLGVGTVVGALAFGFGGGVLLTHTAMKESTPGQTRLERLARAEPQTAAASQAPAAQAAPTPGQAAMAPNEVTPPDHDRPAPVATPKQDAAPAEQPAVAASDPVPAAQAGTPKVDAARKPEPETPRQIQAAREPQPMNQAAREPQPPKQVEQTEAKPVESRETDRRAERSRRYAERRLPDSAAPRVKPQRYIVQEEPAQEVQEVVVPRPPEQPHFDLFGGLFGRPADASD
jgi:hypothetical protein